MDSYDKFNQIITALINNDSFGGIVSLPEFRDIYNQSKGYVGDNNIVWLLFFMNERVYAQPIGNRNFLLEIIDVPPHFYTSEDFDFMSKDDVAQFGTFNGKYTFGNFGRDIFSLPSMIRLIILTLLLSIAIYAFLKPSVIASISGSLVNALAIFISIFCLFVLSINPDTHFRFAETDRYHRLSQADKYIGYIGLGTLIFAIMSSAFASASGNLNADISVWNITRAFQGVFLSCSIMGTIISFWLVINYHFGRKQELTAMDLTKKIMENQQKLYEELITTPRRIK